MDTREKSFIATLDAAQVSPTQELFYLLGHHIRSEITSFCLQEYLSLQQQLGEILRTGFLHLASARYAMGADRVSLLQIPATMTATARVQGVLETPI